jgi:hypothetical protein
MSEEMIERVARAMCEATGTIWGGPRGEADPDFAFVRVFYISMARAAIEASGMNDLLRTATAFIEELKAFGYGETSEKALPGSFDAFIRAVNALKD